MVKNRCKNGDYYWVDAYATPIYLDNKIIGYQSVRTCPSEARKQKADTLYKKIQKGKITSITSRPIIQIQLLSLALIAPLLSGLANYLMPQLNLVWLSVIPLIALLATWVSLAPLRKLNQLGLKIIDNSTAQKIFTQRNDETAAPELAFYAYRAQIRTILGRMNDTLNVVGGFAVVADEVRELAGRAHASTEDIHKTLEQIRSTVTRVVERMEHNEQSIGTSRNQVLDAMNSFTKIEQAFSGIADRETQVAVAISQQRNVAEEIDQRITSINQQASNSLAGAKLANVALQELNNQSHELKSTLRAFN